MRLGATPYARSPRRRRRVSRAAARRSAKTHSADHRSANRSVYQDVQEESSYMNAQRAGEPWEKAFRDERADRKLVGRAASRRGSAAPLGVRERGVDAAAQCTLCPAHTVDKRTANTHDRSFACRGPRTGRVLCRQRERADPGGSAPERTIAFALIQACAAWARYDCIWSRARLGRAIATAARRWRRSDAIDAEVHDRGRVAGCAAQQVRACTQNPAGLSPQTARRRANRASSAG